MKWTSSPYVYSLLDLYALKQSYKHLQKTSSNDSNNFLDLTLSYPRIWSYVFKVEIPVAGWFLYVKKWFRVVKINRKCWKTLERHRQTKLRNLDEKHRCRCIRGAMGPPQSLEAPFGARQVRCPRPSGVDGGRYVWLSLCDT